MPVLTVCQLLLCVHHTQVGSFQGLKVKPVYHWPLGDKTASFPKILLLQTFMTVLLLLVFLKNSHMQLIVILPKFVTPLWSVEFFGLFVFVFQTTRLSYYCCCLITFYNMLDLFLRKKENFFQYLKVNRQQFTYSYNRNIHVTCNIKQL